MGPALVLAMLSSQDNSITSEQLNSLRFEYIKAELANWEHIVFQGDMDDSRKQREASSNSGDHTSKPVNNSTDNTGVLDKISKPSWTDNFTRQDITFTVLHHLKFLLRHTTILYMHCFRCKELYHPKQHITNRYHTQVKDNSRRVLLHPQLFPMYPTKPCTPIYPLRCRLQDLFHNFLPL